MFVSCGNCEAEYELDDAKIPAGGARLRCKKCDHYFVVAPPETSDLQSADDLARDALATEDPDEAGTDSERESPPEGGSSFDIESDLEAAPDEGFSFDAEGDLDAAAKEGFSFDAESDLEAAPDEEFSFDDESDLEAAPDDEFSIDGESDAESEWEEEDDPDGDSQWEFNEEVVHSEPEAGGEASEPEFDKGGEWGELSSAEDVVDGLLGSAGAIETDAASAVDDLLGDSDDAGLELGESGVDLADESELPSERLDLGDAEATEAPGEEPAVDAGDSFDDLSDWDLFDQPEAAGGPALSGGSMGRSAAVKGDGAHAEPRVEIAVAMADESSASLRWTDRISEIAGWGAVVSMLIVALVGGLASNSSEARAPAGSWSGAGFEADQIVGRWVENAVAGPLYVVSGRVRNATGSDGSARKTLGIQLFDTKGREIDRAPIPLAPTVPERVLRESSPAEIDAIQTRRARRITAVGANWFPFEAVVTDLPPFAGRFELQVVDR